MADWKYFRHDQWVLEKGSAPFQGDHQFAVSYRDHPPIYQSHERRGQGKFRRLRKEAGKSYVYMPYALIIFLSQASFVILLLTTR